MINNQWAGLLMVMVVSALAACAHDSTVSPSKGHINAKPDAQASSDLAANIPKPVISKAYLPPPRAKAKEQTYSVVVNEVPVKEILFALARESKLNVDINPAIQGRVTLNAVDQTLPAILERLSKQVDLTYKIEGNVLSISPDRPVLRTYKVDYVNMSRDTLGYIGVAAEIASTGRSASTGAAGSTSSTTSSSGSSSSNSSRTAVASESKNHFWETLISNVKDILAETDKEVIITRSSGANLAETAQQGGSQAGPNPAAANADGTPQNAAPAGNTQSQRDEARTEYKTLFAATVIANPEAGVITIRATNKQHERVQEFLDQVLSSAGRQVLIEASIVEVRLNDTYQAGIDWSRIGNGFNVGTTAADGSASPARLGSTSIINAAGIGTSTLAGSLTPFTIGYFSNDLNVSLRLLQQFGDTKVLSSPKLMVLNNQTAILKVVDNLVYFTVQSQSTQAVNAGTTLSVTTTPNTIPIGVVMSVTPQINDKEVVNINVRPTISRVVDFVTDPNPLLTTVTSRIPVVQVREMESLLRINSGNTAVLGGLMQDSVQRATDRVPGISSAPLIGKLFSAKSDYNIKTELVIFLRPTVIKNASLESDELKSYKQYLPAPQLDKPAVGNDY